MYNQLIVRRVANLLDRIIHDILNALIIAFYIRKLQAKHKKKSIQVLSIRYPKWGLFALD